MCDTRERCDMIHDRKNGFWKKTLGLVCGWRGILILWAVLLPVKILRAHEENSFWVDEIYSVLMAHRSVKELVILAPQHDNLYFLILKIWIKFGVFFTGFPNLFWARLLNVVLWMIFGVVIWFIGRRLLGECVGTLSTWCILSGAMVAHITKELRSYALPAFALYICFLLFLIIWKKLRESDGSKTKFSTSFAFLWISYALCALLTVYVQLLSTLLVFYMGVACLFLGIIAKGRSRSVFLTGFITHILIMILLIPWLLGIRGHLAFVGMNDRRWMSPRTLWNLVRVFLYWFPYGQTPDPSKNRIIPIYLLGVSSMLLPWVSALFAGLFFKDGDKRQKPLLKIALMSAGLSFFYVVTLFLLHCFAGISIFHAPRYPCLATPIWSLGLAAAAVWASRRMKHGAFFIAFLLLPWFLCSLVGQGWMHLLESRGGLYRWKEENPAFFPHKGESLYVIPRELIPYFPEALKEYRAKTLDELASVPPDSRDVYILDLNNWGGLRTQQQIILRKLIKSERLSQSTEIREYSLNFSQFRNYILRDFDHEKAREFFGRNPKRAARDIPASASAIALPENQWINTGWSLLEIDNDDRFFRWATGEKTVILFSGPVAQGRYILHLTGFRHPFPRETVEMKFHIPGEKQARIISQHSGSFHIKLPLLVNHEYRIFKLAVEHPSWKTLEYLQNPKDRRRLSFIFWYGWIEPKT